MYYGSVDSELVVYAARLVRVIRRLEDADSPATLRLLSQLDELGAATVTELARADRTSQPTMSAAVKAMESRGLVRRVAHDTDARSSYVELTEAGREELAGARHRHARLLEQLVARHGVDPAEVDRAVALLRTLTAPVEEE